MAIPLIGTLLEKIIDRGGAIISELVTDKDLAARLNHEFKSLLSTQDHDLNRLILESEAEQFKSQQVTIQAELHQNDLYTKRTRPKIARQSWYLAVTYVLVTLLDAHAMTVLDASLEQLAALDITFEWQLFIAIASPALGYMGVRTFDKWKRPGG